MVSAFQRAQQSGAEGLSTLRFDAADGGRFQAELHIARLPGSDDGPKHSICALADQTEVIRQRDALARAYDALEQSEERYRVLADFSPDWDYWYGPDGAFRYVSPACLDITGYSAEDFRNDADLFERIIHPEDRTKWWPHMGAVDESGDTDTCRPELRIITRSAETRWIAHLCRPVTAPDGRYLGRRGVNRDITKRHEAREALRASEARFRSVFDAAPVGIAMVGGDSKVFVDHLTASANDDAIARAIVALGRGRELEIIAEGVETQAQADFLRREGCAEAQGFLFGRPMSTAELEAFIADGGAVHPKPEA